MSPVLAEPGREGAAENQARGAGAGAEAAGALRKARGALCVL